MVCCEFDAIASGVSGITQQTYVSKHGFVWEAKQSTGEEGGLYRT